MKQTLIFNASIVNEKRVFSGSVLIAGNLISEIFEGPVPEDVIQHSKVIDATGKHLFPGVIDSHVHFREPGLTHKADIRSESCAAVAGGVTSFMDMPNTIPSTTNKEALAEKHRIASDSSICNYSFYLGATNHNVDEILSTEPSEFCGIKVFLGQSTGNMIVDDENSLIKLFTQQGKIVAAHCEDNSIIQENQAHYRKIFGDDVPSTYHHLIRSADACFKSSSYIVNLAEKFNGKLHILHLSTAKETGLFSGSAARAGKKITSEVCVHHLWFDNNDYGTLGNFIKTNPSVKTEEDRHALLKGILLDKIDVISTDHAPHSFEEKSAPYLRAPSGTPMIQHSLPLMLEFFQHRLVNLETIADKMCHAPADIFSVSGRGYIRKGYFADLVIADLQSSWMISRENILYKCKWSPLEGTGLGSQITHTFVNGNLVYEYGIIHDSFRGEKLRFDIK